MFKKFKINYLITSKLIIFILMVSVSFFYLKPLLKNMIPVQLGDYKIETFNLDNNLAAQFKKENNGTFLFILEFPSLLRLYSILNTILKLIYIFI